MTGAIGTALEEHLAPEKRRSDAGIDRRHKAIDAIVERAGDDFSRTDSEVALPPA